MGGFFHDVSNGLLKEVNQLCFHPLYLHYHNRFTHAGIHRLGHYNLERLVLYVQPRIHLVIILEVSLLNKEGWFAG